MLAHPSAQLLVVVEEGERVEDLLHVERRLAERRAQLVERLARRDRLVVAVVVELVALGLEARVFFEQLGEVAELERRRRLHERAAGERAVFRRQLAAFAVRVVEGEVVDEREHPILLEERMPDLRARARRLQRTVADEVLLRAQGTLGEDRVVKLLPQGIPLFHPLRVHDDGELLLVMLQTSRVAAADARLRKAALLGLQEAEEVLPEGFRAGRGDFLRQARNVRLDGAELFVGRLLRPVLAVRLGRRVLARALEAAPLGDVVERAAERERRDFAVGRRRAVAVGVRGVGRLEPVEERPVAERVDAVSLPGVEFLLRQGAEAVRDQHLQELPLADLPAELQATRHPRRTSDGGLRIQRVCLRNALREDDDALVEDIARQVVEHGPAERVRPKIKTYRFSHRSPP